MAEQSLQLTVNHLFTVSLRPCPAFTVLMSTFSSTAQSSTLKTEADNCSKMLVPIYQTTQHHIPKGNVSSQLRPQEPQILSHYAQTFHIWNFWHNGNHSALTYCLFCSILSQLMQCSFQIFLHMMYKTAVTKPHQNQHDPRAYITSVINQLVSVKHD